MNARGWADDIAGRLVASFPVTKARGGVPDRSAVALMLTPACSALADLEAEFGRQRQALSDLAAMNWGAPDLESLAFPFPGRTEPLRAGEWDTRLTPVAGAR